jgi:hypothetical protein
VAFNEQNKGQHVTIDGLVTNTFACLALFVREEGATTLIWAGKLSTWSGRAPLTGKSRAVRAYIACESVAILAMVKPLSVIKSPAVRTTATLVATLLHSEDARLVALDVTELKLVIRENVSHTVPTSNSIDAMMTQVPHPCFGIVLNKHSNVRDTEVLRQEVLIVEVAVRVDIRLEGGDNVGILQGGNCFEEHGRAIPGVDEDLLFGLEAKIELVALSKSQYVGVMIPGRLLEGNRWIKHWNSEFENAPKQVIVILGLDANGGEFGLYLSIGGGKESGEQLKECRSTFMVALRSKTRHKQTFKIIPQSDGIKQHEWEEVGMGELLEFIVELDGIVHIHSP